MFAWMASTSGKYLRGGGRERGARGDGRGWRGAAARAGRRGTTARRRRGASNALGLLLALDGHAQVVDRLARLVADGDDGALLVHVAVVQVHDLVLLALHCSAQMRGGGRRGERRGGGRVSRTGCMPATHVRRRTRARGGAPMGSQVMLLVGPAHAKTGGNIGERGKVRRKGERAACPRGRSPLRADRAQAAQATHRRRRSACPRRCRCRSTWPWRSRACPSWPCCSRGSAGATGGEGGWGAGPAASGVGGGRRPPLARDAPPRRQQPRTHLAGEALAHRVAAHLDVAHRLGLQVDGVCEAAATGERWGGERRGEARGAQDERRARCTKTAAKPRSLAAWQRTAVAAVLVLALQLLVRHLAAEGNCRARRAQVFGVVIFPDSFHAASSASPLMSARRQQLVGQDGSMIFGRIFKRTRPE